MIISLWSFSSENIPLHSQIHDFEVEHVVGQTCMCTPGVTINYQQAIHLNSNF